MDENNDFPKSWLDQVTGTYILLCLLYLQKWKYIIIIIIIILLELALNRGALMYLHYDLAW